MVLIRGDRPTSKGCVPRAETISGKGPRRCTLSRAKARLNRALKLWGLRARAALYSRTAPRKSPALRSAYPRSSAAAAVAAAAAACCGADASPATACCCCCCSSCCWEVRLQPRCGDPASSGTDAVPPSSASCRLMPARPVRTPGSACRQPPGASCCCCCLPEAVASSPSEHPIAGPAAAACCCLAST